jgi:hypothetical protein
MGKDIKPIFAKFEQKADKERKRKKQERRPQYGNTQPKSWNPLSSYPKYK